MRNVTNIIPSCYVYLPIMCVSIVAVVKVVGCASREGRTLRTVKFLVLRFVGLVSVLGDSFGVVRDN